MMDSRTKTLRTLLLAFATMAFASASGSSISPLGRQAAFCPNRETPYKTAGCSSFQYAVGGGATATFSAPNGVWVYANRIDKGSTEPIYIKANCGGASIHPPPIKEDPTGCYPELSIRPQPMVCTVTVRTEGARVKLFGCNTPEAWLNKWPQRLLWCTGLPTMRRQSVLIIFSQ